MQRCPGYLLADGHLNLLLNLARFGGCRGAPAPARLWLLRTRAPRSQRGKRRLRRDGKPQPEVPCGSGLATSPGSTSSSRTRQGRRRAAPARPAAESGGEGGGDWDSTLQIAAFASARPCLYHHPPRNQGSRRECRSATEKIDPPDSVMNERPTCSNGTRSKYKRHELSLPGVEQFKDGVSFV